MSIIITTEAGSITNQLPRMLVEQEQISDHLRRLVTLLAPSESRLVCYEECKRWLRDKTSANLLRTGKFSWEEDSICEKMMGRGSQERRVKLRSTLFHILQIDLRSLDLYVYLQAKVFISTLFESLTTFYPNTLFNVNILLPDERLRIFMRA